MLTPDVVVSLETFHLIHGLFRSIMFIFQTFERLSRYVAITDFLPILVSLLYVLLLYMLLLLLLLLSHFSRVRLFATPWTVAYQAPPPMGFSRQEYWSGLPLPSPLYILQTPNALFTLINCQFFLFLKDFDRHSRTHSIYQKLFLYKSCLLLIP